MSEYILRLVADIALWSQAGGNVGRVIIALGVFGCAYGIWRCWALWRLRQAVAQEVMTARARPADDLQGSPTNPMAVVMATVKTHQHADTETLELHLDEVMTRELPLLKRGTTVIKLLAAITPLLGLLGTVVGMIDAMQAMAEMAEAERTRAMASGISQALTTTMLGLAFAVPLILLHAVTVATGGAIATRLEEYCAREIAAKAVNSAKVANAGNTTHKD